MTDEENDRPLLLIRPLTAADKAACRRVRCGGHQDIDTYIRAYAWKYHEAGMSKTYVTTIDGDIAGFVTLASGSLKFDQSVPSKPKMPRWPVPVLLLAQLGVDKRFSRRGIGSDLVAFALVRAREQRAVGDGCVALTTDPIDDDAVRFYKGLGFDFIPFTEHHPDTRGRPPPMFLSLYEVEVVDRET